jgi:hypothetical protein
LGKEVKDLLCPLPPIILFIVNDLSDWYNWSKVTNKNIFGVCYMPHIVVKTISGPSKKQLQDAAEQIAAVVNKTRECISNCVNGNNPHYKG